MAGLFLTIDSSNSFDSDFHPSLMLDDISTENNSDTIEDENFFNSEDL